MTDEKNGELIEPNKRLDFLINQFSRIYDQQVRDIDSFDQKINFFLVFLSILFIFLIEQCYFFSAVLSLVSIALCMWILFPRNFKSPFSPSDILSKHWKKGINIEKAQEDIVAGFSDAIEKNKKTNKEKSKMSKFMLFSVFLALVFIFLESRL